MFVALTAAASAGRHLLRDRRGVSALEYGLIASLLAVAIIAAVSALGSRIGLPFGAVSSKL